MHVAQGGTQFLHYLELLSAKVPFRHIDELTQLYSFKYLPGLHSKHEDYDLHF